MAEENGLTGKETREYWEKAYAETLQRYEEVKRRLLAPDLNDEERKKLGDDLAKLEQELEAIGAASRMLS